MQASELQCCVCEVKQAVAFWPCIDPDIPSHPYCRECLDDAQTRVLTKLYKHGEQFAVIKGDAKSPKAPRKAKKAKLPAKNKTTKTSARVGRNRPKPQG